MTAIPKGLSKATQDLFIAAKTGDMDKLRAAIKNKADVKATDIFKRTALHIAAQGGHKKIYAYLITKIDHKAEDDLGQTAVQYLNDSMNRDRAPFINSLFS